MKRNALKWTVLGGALAIIVMYGIEMSSSGIEEIYGPIEAGNEYIENVQPEPSAHPEPDHALNQQQQKIAQLEKELAEIKRLAAMSDDAYNLKPEPVADLPSENVRLPGVPLETEQPAVNRIADSTSGLLQNMSSEGIRFVVSIFDGLTK
ncbi:hypothetical protein L1N85_20745 [Paenibacillus alkaliterrae]|uniref:hypothetical protein n=1 Tax=Paenibacillus alkaliterrae TaxID=320909 RepID=UPI001F1B2BAA|nr:hypothetical protein [Paenibacillus alkaliterrae]MCF2940824.1 hypothetical protein [Paenibacillus alkaliterrae]